MLWTQLVAILVVGVYYVHFLVHAGPGHHYLHALLLVFGSVRFVAHRRAASVVDERDRSIAAIGTRWSNVILWLGLVLILALYWDQGSLRSANLIIGLIFHLLLLAGIARIVRELVAYRINA